MNKRYLIILSVVMLLIMVMPAGQNTTQELSNFLNDAPDMTKQMIEATDGAVDNVERFEGTAAAASTTGDFTLSGTYTLSRTIFFPQIRTASTTDDHEDVGLTFYWKDTNEITWLRGDNDFAVTVVLHIVEFASTSGVTVYEVGPIHAPSTVAIGGTVDMSETFIINNGATSAEVYMPTRSVPWSYLSSTTQVTLVRGGDSDVFSNYYCQVVEVTGASVQRGNCIFATTSATTIDDDLGSAVTIARSSIFGQISALTWDNLNNKYYQVNPTFVDTDTIRFTRYPAGQFDQPTIYWEVVEWPSGVSVEYVSMGFGSGDTTDSVTITEVDTSVAISLQASIAPHHSYGGVGTVSQADDNNHYSRAETEITDSTTCVITRGGSGYATTGYVTIIEFVAPNAAPVNDAAPACTNLDDTNNLYARYKTYYFTSNVSDANGYADIDYVDLMLFYPSPPATVWKIRYNETSNVFSEIDGAANVELLTASSTYTKSGNDLDITWHLKIEWAASNQTACSLRQWVYDADSDSDDDTYAVGYDVESRLDLSVGPVLSDGTGTVDRGDYDTVGSITASGAVIYFGSTDNYPPIDEIDVWVVCSDTPDTDWNATNYEASTGTFSVAVDSDDVVGLDTYTFKAVSQGTASGGTDLMDTSHTDTYIADRAQVQWIVANDTSVGVNDVVNLTVGLKYDYDNTAVDTGSYSLQYSSTYLTLTFLTLWNWSVTDFAASAGVRTYNAVNGSDTTHGISKTDVNSMSEAVTWDRINLTIVINRTWQVITYNVTITVSGLYHFGGETWNGTATLNSTWSAPYYAVFSSSGNRTFLVTSITNDDNDVVAFDTNTIWCYWDSISISSVSYFWVQYTFESVWLLWNPGTYTWDQNDTIVADSPVCKIQSQVNGTNDDWAVVYGTTSGDMSIGEFDQTWYYANITMFAQVTIGGTAYNWSIWSALLNVDILHSIHIEDYSFIIQDNWITFTFHTNWDNATITIWDNITASQVEVGYSPNEGSYQIAKPTVVGLHYYTICINGSHSGGTSASQDSSGTDSDSWQMRYEKFTINPVTFSITDPFAMQNNVSIIFAATFYTGDLTLDYTIYEDGIFLDSGVMTIPFSGSYYVLKWDKSSATSVANWTVVIQSSSTNITIFGYNMIMDSSNYEETYNSSYFQEGDVTNNDYRYDEDAVIAEKAWLVLGQVIQVLLTALVVIMALVVGLRVKRRRSKRDRFNDDVRPWGQ